MNPAQKAALFLSVSALAVPLIAGFEGWAPVGYADLGGVATACYGHTGPDAVKGRRYSPADCAALLSGDTARKAAAIDPCLPEATPMKTRAAFVSFAFNVGSPAFCSSTASRKALAGDLPGACAELSRWVNVQGHPVAGLVRRRAAERALCEEGLKP